MDEKLQKAFDALGIKTAEQAAPETDLVKAVELKDARIAELEAELVASREEAQLLKAAGAGGEGSELVKAQMDVIDSKFAELAVIEKGVYDLVSVTKDLVSKAVETAERLEKSVEDQFAEIQEGIDAAIEKVEAIGSAPRERKSFANARHIEKGFTEDGNGNTVLSKAADGKAILAKLDDLMTSNPDNGSYADAVIRFETSGQLTKAIITDLEKNHNIVITD